MFFLAHRQVVARSNHSSLKPYNASAQLAKAGGKAAEAARLNLEEQLGHSIISREKATDYLPPADRWDSLPEEKDDDEN